MAIQAVDIKLLAAAVMDDVPEGGQGPVAHVIEDNEPNEIFKDISEAVIVAKGQMGYVNQRYEVSPA